MIVGVTAHRPDKLWGYNMSHPNYDKLQSYFEKQLMELNCTDAWTGMAIGGDMVFAHAVLTLQDWGVPIKLHAAIPCDNHPIRWPKYVQDEYKRILNKCASKVYVCKGPYAGWKMQRRNEYIVDHIDHLLAVCDGSPSGTQNCIDYAAKKNVPTTILTPIEVAVLY